MTTTTENTMTNMNINTLFAAIVDTLATAVAAKIAPPDVTLAVKEALANMDLSDVFDIDGHVQHAVRDMDLSDAFDIDSKVDDAVSSYDMSDAVESALEDFDMRDAVQSALDDMDLKDMFDINDKVNDAIGDMDLSDMFDTEAAVRSALDNMDMSDVFNIEDAVAEHIDSCIDEKLAERLKTITDTLAVAAVGMDETRVRAIVREEMRAVFMSVAMLSDSTVL